MTKPDVVTPAEAMAVNRRFWEEAVPVHVASAFYDVDGFRRGRCTLSPIESAELGDVSGLRVAHLQCHFGMDTLSLVRRGAVVTGFDYSSAAIAAARRLSDETGLEARFVAANVYDAPSVADDTFDLVFTTWGVLSWLPDLEAWGEVVARLLHPGGRFYLAEAHPAVHWFDETAPASAPLLHRHDFRGHGAPLFFDEPGSYADPEAPIENTVEYAYVYTLEGVVSALARAGLVIDFLHEHDALAWQALPALEPGDDGLWRMPAERPRIPLSFSIAARRP